MVLESASVTDVVIDNQGRHIIAYNDTSTGTLVKHSVPTLLFGNEVLSVSAVSDWLWIQ